METKQQLDKFELLKLSDKALEFTKGIATKISRNSPAAISKAIKAINANFKHDVDGKEPENGIAAAAVKLLKGIQSRTGTSA